MPNNPNAVDNLQPFKPGESGNPNGRPRKMVSQVLKDLDDAGIEHVTKEQVRGAIEVLLNCQKDDLMQYANDESHSTLIRIVARHLIKAGDNERLFNMLLDRAFGRPDSSVDLTSSDGSMSPPSSLKDLYDEERQGSDTES